jgi:hypothetical protein
LTRVAGPAADGLVHVLGIRNGDVSDVRRLGRVEDGQTAAAAGQTAGDDGAWSLRG